MTETWGRKTCSFYQDYTNSHVVYQCVVLGRLWLENWDRWLLFPFIQIWH